jgi:mannose-1-phosphate guanylyltransferase
LLEQTLDRVSLSIEPEHTLVALTRHHEHFYGPLLARMPERNLVVQPQNRGTAPAILYSLLRLVELAPKAAAAIFPSDHFVDGSRRFIQHVDTAFDVARSRPELTLLLGIEPQAPETGYGWIEPALSVPDSPAFLVRRFWEKPSAELAEELCGRGCLWNSFVMVGQVATLVGLFIVALPDLYLSFKKVQPMPGTALEDAAVERLYNELRDSSFSEQVLAKRAVNLGILPVQGVDWSDLGEPRRVCTHRSSPELGRRIAPMRIVGRNRVRLAVPGVNPTGIAVELVRHWHWICVDDGSLIPGWDLCVVTPDSGLVVRLAQCPSNAVPRDDLRHDCGSRVTPRAPLNAT